MLIDFLRLARHRSTKSIRAARHGDTAEIKPCRTRQLELSIYRRTTSMFARHSKAIMTLMIRDHGFQKKECASEKPPTSAKHEQSGSIDRA